MIPMQGYTAQGWLLIVPYGIETSQLDYSREMFAHF